MKILVTGGAGFIGSHLTNRLIQEGHRVVIIDNLSTGGKENLNSKAKFYKIDVRNSKISQIFKKEKPEIVFHYAAQIEAGKSVREPVFDAEVNIVGSLNVLENCKKYRIRHIFFASSGGEIYGGAKKIPTPETYISSPISPYGIGKLTVENYLNSYYQMFKIPFTALRYGNVYGPRQNPYGESGVIAIFIKKMLKREQPIIYGDGKQTKDYIFIEDAVEATILSFKKRFTGILNIGTEKETSVLEIFYKLKELTHSQVKEKHVPLQPWSFKRGCLFIKKAKKELNWQPKYSLEKGLKKTVEYFKAELLF